MEPEHYGTVIISFIVTLAWIPFIVSALRTGIFKFDVYEFKKDQEPFKFYFHLGFIITILAIINIGIVIATLKELGYTISFLDQGSWTEIQYFFKRHGDFFLIAFIVFLFAVGIYHIIKSVKERKWILLLPALAIIFMSLMWAASLITFD